MLKIVDIAMEEMLSKVASRSIEIELTKTAKEFLAEKGFDPVYGARPLKRTIQKYIEDPLAEEILKDRFSDGSKIQIKKRGEHLDFSEAASSKSKSRTRRIKNEK
jgi:ATP-dependent Clp protease ATP-binding subunit ClpA